jgi:hypothetical protein
LSGLLPKKPLEAVAVVARRRKRIKCGKWRFISNASEVLLILIFIIVLI